MVKLSDNRVNMTPIKIQTLKQVPDLTTKQRAVAPAMEAETEQNRANG